MPGNVEMNDFSGSKLHHDENKQNMQTEGVVDKEITNPEDRPLVLQKRPPTDHRFRLDDNQFGSLILPNVSCARPSAQLLRDGRTSPILRSRLSLFAPRIPLGHESQIRKVRIGRPVNEHSTNYSEVNLCGFLGLSVLLLYSASYYSFCFFSHIL